MLPVHAPQVLVAPTTPRPARLPSLTGLRFIAAFAVFGFHVHTGGLVDEGPIGTAFAWVFDRGAAGVSFFFILSGYVLAWSARPDDTAAQFWRRRAAKIYPNHLATWVIALVGVMATGAALSVTIAVSNVLLIQAWSPDADVYFGMNTVSWSLACELFFYALFPVLYHGLKRLPGRALWPAALGAMALILLVPVAAQALPETHRYWAIWVLPVARLPEFALGMVLARVVLSGRWPALAIWHTVVLTAVAYVVSRWLPWDFRIVASTAIPLALLIAAVGASDAINRQSFLRSRWAVWLGEISFAFYLLHHLCLRLIAKAVGTEHSALVELAVAMAALGITVVLSWLLYRYLETPAMRRLANPRRAGAR